MSCAAKLGSDQIGILLHLVRHARATAERLNLSTRSYKLLRIELHLMKALNPAMKPFARHLDAIEEEVTT